VNFLLNTGRVNTNSKDREGLSPLQYAAANCHWDVVKLLVNIQAVDINWGDTSCKCSLIAATHGGSYAVVRALRDTGRFSSFSIGDALKATILDLGDYEYLEKLQILLAARTNTTVSHALRALEMAAEKSHHQVVEGLLSIQLNAEANANQHNQAGRDRAKLLDVLAERHCRDEPSMIAALSACSDDPGATAKAFEVWVQITRVPIGFSRMELPFRSLKRLLPYLTIEQISCKDLRHCKTLLHWATQKEDEALMKRCIHLGASVEAQDKYGNTPLQYAARFSVFRLLFDAGAHTTAEQVNKSFRDEHCKSLLHWAAETGSGDVAKRCLQLGADVEAKDAHGETPLHYAAESGHFSIVKSLVEADSDLDAIDVHGRKPLDCAMGKGPGENSNRRVDVEVVNYLTISTNSANYLDKLTSPKYQQGLMAM
jgi:ankyrin repeat protein